nr:hypothetical protein [Actinomycetota bacterium]
HQDVLSATGDDKTAASGIFYPAKINTHERDQRVAELSNRVPQAEKRAATPPVVTSLHCADIGSTFIPTLLRR